MKKTLLFFTAWIIVVFIPILEINAQTLKGFGDSITKGVGVSDSTKTWLYLLAQETGSIYRNYGVPSSTVYQNGVPGKNFINTSEYSLTHDPVTGYVTIMYGTNNDGNNGSSEWRSKYKKTIKDFIDAGYPKDHIILCSPPYTDFFSPLGLPHIVEAAEEIATQLEVKFADVHTYTKNHGGSSLYNPWDLLHPNEMGNRVIANYVKTFVTPANTLPVKFTLFNSLCNNGSIKLTWKTSEELNSKRFDIERSVNGTSWQVVGSVNAAGTSTTERSYTFTDNTPGANKLYRIAEHDFDNKKTYSVIAKSSCSAKEELTVWPNPVRDAATVSISAGTTKKVTLTVYDVKGTAVQQLHKELSAGNNQFQLDVSTLTNGIYTLIDDEGNNVKTTKLIKN